MKEEEIADSDGTTFAVSFSLEEVTKKADEILPILRAQIPPGPLAWLALAYTAILHLRGAGASEDEVVSMLSVMLRNMREDGEVKVADARRYRRLQ